MPIQDVVGAIDQEIARLQQARELLNGGAEQKRTYTPSKNGRGHHVMSAAARRKISLAQKARWAKQRKAT